MEADDIKYKPDIKEQTVRIKSRHVMMSDGKKPTKMRKMKADYHRLEAVHNRKCGG